MFYWEPDGRYCCTKSMALAPFWFSTEHSWTGLMPIWLSADDKMYWFVSWNDEMIFHIDCFYNPSLVRNWTSGECTTLKCNQWLCLQARSAIYPPRSFVNHLNMIKAIPIFKQDLLFYFCFIKDVSHLCLCATQPRRPSACYSKRQALQFRTWQRFWYLLFMCRIVMLLSQPAFLRNQVARKHNWGTSLSWRWMHALLNIIFLHW